jgi:SAM-dependent methyltransferase
VTPAHPRLTTFRRILGYLPPPIRRTASGLWLDLASLPERLHNPSRRGDPWQTLHNIGPGDFQGSGAGLMGDLIYWGGLKPSDHVLDIGCGVGRATLALADHLDGTGGYIGFDISRRAVESCRKRFARLRPDFAFVWLDVRNGDYNAGGTIAETEARFPCDEGAIDLAFAASVFSHLRIETIRRYLAEAARTLKPGGRFFFTAYTLTAERRGCIERHGTRLAFLPWTDGSMVMDPRSPERAIAHDAEVLEAAVQGAGLRLAGPWRRGHWAPGAEFGVGGLQDIWVVEKP